jgi:ABC-type phosphate transport system permease subunit
MSVHAPPPANAEATSLAQKGRIRYARQGNSLTARGEPSIWGTGGALAVAIVMIVGLMVLVIYYGAPTFWPKEVVLIRTLDGKLLMGEIIGDESYAPDEDVFAALPPQDREKAIQAVKDAGGVARRRKVRTGNFELTNRRTEWVSDFQIAAESKPQWALVIERMTSGYFYGTPTAFAVDDTIVATDPEKIWEAFSLHMAEVQQRRQRRISLERNDIGAVSRKVNQARLALRQAELDHGKDSPEYNSAADNYEEVKKSSQTENEKIHAEINALQKANDRLVLQLVTADEQTKALKMEEIVRAYPANQLGLWDKLGVYGSRWREFLWDNPREGNTEGGVYPVIFGTVAMTLLMSLAVVPFGVLAALYLREYAKSGPIISAVRIAINNLAGVPSIVFGVFGLGFFCYLVGAFVDGGPRNIQVNPWPPGTWWLGLAGAVVVGVTAFFVGAIAGKDSWRDSWLGKSLGTLAPLLWLLSLAAMIYLIVKMPYFHGLFEANLPNPTFGTGGVLWAALTLALLTVPVVIVATEEALAAVPNSMREGSYACGASKWQTVRRIVLPRAMPGIMTGMILAMARGAGEVAPIMYVGAMQMAPDLLLDGVPPYLHLQRGFMHLGYHIFHLGFQSPDSEAARPMVFTTTLLLIGIVALLNLTAVWLRSRLRRRYLVSQF